MAGNSQEVPMRSVPCPKGILVEEAAEEVLLAVAEEVLMLEAEAAVLVAPN
jgi:hypothetical protein